MRGLVPADAGLGVLHQPGALHAVHGADAPARAQHHANLATGRTNDSKADFVAPTGATKATAAPLRGLSVAILADGSRKSSRPQNPPELGGRGLAISHVAHTQ